MKKQIFAAQLAVGFAYGAWGSVPAEARGTSYIARDELGRVKCDMYITQVAESNDIVEIVYRDRDSGSGRQYRVTATGYLSPNGLVIRHGNKDLPSGAIDTDFAYSEYPVQDLPDGFIVKPNQENKAINTFFMSEYADEMLPNQYTQNGNVIPYVSNFGVRMLIESLGYETTKLDSFYYYSPDNPYIYEYTDIPDLQAAYPQAGLVGHARRMQVSVVDESGLRSTINTFIVDDALENVWRVEQDGSLFQSY